MKCYPIICLQAFTLNRVIGLVDNELGPRPISGIGPIVGRMRLPTDPMGVINLTLSGVPAGCEVRIRDKDTNELAGIESCIDNPVFTWPVYSSGSPYNTVRILVISTSYELIDFLYTCSIGSFSIPIEMREDPWFKDPV